MHNLLQCFRGTNMGLGNGINLKGDEFVRVLRGTTINSFEPSAKFVVKRQRTVPAPQTFLLYFVLRTKIALRMVILLVSSSGDERGHLPRHDACR